MDNGFRELGEDMDGGSIEGYRVRSTSEQVPNWLSDQVGADAAEVLTSAIVGLCADVAILKSIRVDDDKRGQGIGSSLLACFLDDAATDAVLLLSDAAETQNEGFDLRTWYEDYDFAVVTETSCGPLMAWPPEVARGMREALGHAPARMPR